MECTCCEKTLRRAQRYDSALFLLFNSIRASQAETQVTHTNVGKTAWASAPHEALTSPGLKVGCAQSTVCVRKRT